MEKISYIYLMDSASRRALYTGVTANTCYRLVYFERFTSIEVAIAREKEIKGWRRQKKNKLVETVNPEWKDLASDWYPKELLKDRHSGTI